MNDAVLYAKSNCFQRITTTNVLDEFSHELQWQEGGCDSILDIGCGTGDVTIELILPILPSNFSRLLGCDISDKMIEYAQQHYGHPKVIFDKLDISDDVVVIDEFLTKFGSFDHVVSFFCLHWVRNQEAAIKNITKLLTPNGDCLLLFITSCNVYTVHDEMSKSSKWSQHMKDVKLFTSPYYQSVCPTEDLRALLQAVGFTSCEIRTRELRHMYNNYDEFFGESHSNLIFKPLKILYRFFVILRLRQVDKPICK